MNERIGQLIENLQKNGFEVLYAESREEAKEKILNLIFLNDKIGVGGSITIRELGLIEALSQRGNVVVHHWRKGLSCEEVGEVLKEELNSDVFLTSSNAVTMDGKLVNMDMTGNRVSAMIFGPNKAIVAVGINKIVEDVEGAIERIRKVAAPLNAKRIGAKTPCVKTGYCTDCDSPDRICRVTTIIEKKPSRSDITVVLINEELGY